ncbi:MAG: alkaline phosphatase D family protein [Candidatus Competibacteraceae bacterium]|nr:alkaline phosphatase D family protein [Candidatus Competibacteraceae bacterium]
MADFQNPPLEDMVALGAVQPTGVRLWLRSRHPGTLRIQWWRQDGKGGPGETMVEASGDVRRDGTLSLTLPPPEDPPLEPQRHYRFRVTRLADDKVIGEGRFQTAPGSPEATPPKFSIALYSCHQPFDKRGAVRQEARQMLAALGRCLEDHDTRLVLEVGDQMYSDLPGPLSLFDDKHFPTVAPPGTRQLLDCSAEQVRRLYQNRYRYFWNVPGWPEIHTDYPCYPILDDHDIVDNWGSDPAHKEPRWQAFFKGVRLAYRDYQGSRVLADDEARERSLYYDIIYGHTSVFVMDLRSERRAGEEGRLYSDQQERALGEFLVANRHQQVLLLVLSVPIIHLSRTLARLVSKLPPQGEDFSDRWSSGPHLRDRDRMLRMLREHQHHCPRQKLILLSGDIHIGCLHRMCWNDGDPVFYQLVSSPITHHNSWWIQWASKWLIRMNRRFATWDGKLGAQVELLPGVGRQDKNPYGGLNFGMLEVETPPDGSVPTIRFLLYGHKGDEPVCVYRSPEL